MLDILKLKKTILHIYRQIIEVTHFLRLHTILFYFLFFFSLTLFVYIPKTEKNNKCFIILPTPSNHKHFPCYMYICFEIVLFR